MIIYSKRIIQFVDEIKSIIKDVLSQEVGLKVGRSRFLDKKQKASYPLQVVVFNNKSMLGYFDPNFYELGFHQCLMHSSKEQLRDVIRHEIAHYMTYINYGEVQAHGAEFRIFCQLLGWGEEVYKATTCLDGGLNITEESAVLRKVQKLMALANSSNQNEAEQAMIKSQQLLLKHNIESKYVDSTDEDAVVLKRILKQKKESAKMRAIGKILETFFVSTVYSRGGGFIYLEILGSPVNVEIAEYVADTLQLELEHLWNQAQKYTNLKGTIAKNSFFLGIAKGYCNKIQALKREYNSDETHAIMVIEKKLIDAKAMAYPRLSSSRSQGTYCPESSALGEKMGKQLNINPAIDKASKSSGALIGYERNG